MRDSLSLFCQTGVKQRKLVGCDGVTSWNYPIVTEESYKLDSLIRKKQIDDKYKPFKYTMLMMLRLKCGGKNMPKMVSNKFERYCESIKTILWNDSKIVTSFNEICNLLDRELDGNYDRAIAKTIQFTNKINSIM
jgi:hypothetical protein